MITRIQFCRAGTYGQDWRPPIDDEYDVVCKCDEHGTWTIEIPSYDVLVRERTQRDAVLRAVDVLAGRS